MSDVNTNLDRTMWCPKKCDLLVLNTISDPYEFKWSSKGVIFLLIALLSGYIAINEPLFIFDNLPIEIPVFYFLIIAISKRTPLHEGQTYSLIVPCEKRNEIARLDIVITRK